LPAEKLKVQNQPKQFGFGGLVGGILGGGGGGGDITGGGDTTGVTDVGAGGGGAVGVVVGDTSGGGAAPAGSWGDVLVSGVGEIGSKVVGGVISGLILGQLQKLIDAGKIPPALGSVIAPGLEGLLNTLVGQIPTSSGGGPGFAGAPGGLEIAAQPFDPGGYGGAVLSSAPYLGQAGAVAGALLKSKKIQLKQLTGSAGVLAQLLQRGGGVVYG
jgi:hypothetical protein